VNCPTRLLLVDPGDTEERKEVLDRINRIYRMGSGGQGGDFS
jgi:hypothetical protein